MSRRSHSPSFLYSMRHPFRSRHSSRSLTPPRSPSYSDYGSYHGSHHRSHHGLAGPVDIALLIREAYERFREGMSRRRSESLHRRVYGGMVDASRIMAVQLGAAAGVEAWKRHNYRNGGIVDVDTERQVRSLVEAAVYEVDRWWDHGDRDRGSHGKKEALLAAAIIAIKLFHKGDRGHHRHKHRSRSRLDSHGSDSSWSSSSSSSGHGRGREFLRDAGGLGLAAGLGRYLGGRSGHRSDYDLRSEYGGPSVYGGRSEYGDYGDEYYRGRSLSRHRHHRGSSGLLSTVLPALEMDREYRHHRTYSPSRRHDLPLEGLMDTLTLGSHHRHHGHHSHHLGRDYYDDYGYGRSHRHHHGGTEVVRAISGDPTSEYGHLAPGTYVVEGGGHRHRSRGLLM